MAHVKVFCFLASYLVVFGLELTRFLRRSSINHFLMLGFGLAGFIAHTSYLWHRGMTLEMAPLLSSSQDWMLVLAWIAILLYLFFMVFDRESAIGLFLLPVVLILIGAAYFVSKNTNAIIRGADPQHTALQNWALLHASLMVFGIAGVLLGFVLSLMYVVQHHRLKNKQSLKEGMALPSLPRLARWNRWTVIISVPLLTLGLGSGVQLGFLSQSAAHPISLQDPFVLGTGVTWLVMLAFFVWLLKGRHSTGKRVAWLTIWAFGFMLVTMIGLQLLTSGWLSTWHSQLFVPTFWNMS